MAFRMQILLTRVSYRVVGRGGEICFFILSAFASLLSYTSFLASANVY